MINVFAPFVGTYETADQVCGAAFLSQNCLSYCADRSAEFLSKFGAYIINDPEFGNRPETVALGYWLRKANIKTIVESVRKRLPGNCIPKPRGVAFHNAPSNVDTIFIYSWALSLLAGNSNILRISQTPGEVAGFLVSAVNKVIKDFPEIAERNLILTYPHDDPAGSYFSSVSDLRIVWGGDSTVSTIRSFPSKPAVKDISFADKVSWTVIDSRSYLELTDENAAKLAVGFRNDSYIFDQMGCSSPRYVFFIGEEELSAKASSKFWDKLKNEINRRKAFDEISTANNKTVDLYARAAGGEKFTPVLMPAYDCATVIRASADDVLSAREICGGGFFTEFFVKDLESIVPHVMPGDQTVSCFGFTKDRLQAFVESLPGRGIDRIVPVGKAADFQIIWDGYDLLPEMSRLVSIDPSFCD